MGTALRTAGSSSKKQPLASLCGFYRSGPNASAVIANTYSDSFSVSSAGVSVLTCAKAGKYRIVGGCKMRYCASALRVGGVAKITFPDSSSGDYSYVEKEIELEIAAGEEIKLVFTNSSIDDRGQVVNYDIFKV